MRIHKIGSMMKNQRIVCFTSQFNKSQYSVKPTIYQAVNGGKTFHCALK